MVCTTSRYCHTFRGKFSSSLDSDGCNLQYDAWMDWTNTGVWSWNLCCASRHGQSRRNHRTHTVVVVRCAIVGGGNLMQRSQRQATTIFVVVTISGIVYYALNNAYSSWAFNPTTSWWMALVAYYVVTQPIYMLFLWLMHDKYGARGLLAAVLFIVSSDIMSLPHSIPSLWMQGQTTVLPNEPNMAPYPDWQIGRLLAPNGVLMSQQVILIFIIVPTILNFIVFLMVKPKAYKELVEHM